MYDFFMGKWRTTKFLLGFILMFVGIYAIVWVYSWQIERFRIVGLSDEMRVIQSSAIAQAFDSMQHANQNELLFEGGQLKSSYKTYLSSLKGQYPGDGIFQNVVNTLENVSLGNKEFTPLAFGLSYIDTELLKKEFDKNVRDIAKVKLAQDFDTEHSRGTALKSIYSGPDRYRIESTNVEVDGPHVFDMTNVSTSSQNVKDMYAYLYGTTASDAWKSFSSSNTDGSGQEVRRLLAGKKYVIVYYIKSTIKWVPFTNTPFFKQHKGLFKPYESSYGLNSGEYMPFGEFTFTQDSVYAITE